MPHDDPNDLDTTLAELRRRTDALAPPPDLADRIAARLVLDAADLRLQIARRGPTAVLLAIAAAVILVTYSAILPTDLEFIAVELF